MVDRAFVDRNTAERVRLETLVARLGDPDLVRPFAGGWTVAAKLAHLAFWEQRALVLLQKWEHEGAGPSPVDDGVVNDALLPQWRVLPARAVTRHLVEVVRAVDRTLESAGDEVIAAVDAAGRPFTPFRSYHRAEHLDEIERALTAAGP